MLRYPGSASETAIKPPTRSGRRGPGSAAPQIDAPDTTFFTGHATSDVGIDFVFTGVDPADTFRCMLADAPVLDDGQDARRWRRAIPTRRSTRRRRPTCRQARVTPPLAAPVTPPTPSSAPAAPANAKPATGPAPSGGTTAAVKHLTKAPSCVSRRSVTLHWRVPKGHHVVMSQLIVNGRVVTTLRPGAVQATVSLAGRPQRVVHVIVRARDDENLRLQTDRSYATCVAPNGHAALHSLVLQVS